MKNTRFVIFVVILAFVTFSIPLTAEAFGNNGSKKGMMGMKDKKGKLSGQKEMSENIEKADSTQIDPEVAGAFFAMKADIKAMKKRGFIETGLRPVYPDSLDCKTANSYFGSTKRGDGSFRSSRFYNGYHGGFDIPAKGENIIAMADGEVVEKSEGANIGGIKVVLRHSPEDTGLGVWTFTEYKHLKEPSLFNLHERVRMGDVIGIAWNTGTSGGKAYGPSGHYHLHLSAWYNNTGEYKIHPKMLIPVDGYWADPLALMRGIPLESWKIKNLPDDAKDVTFAYKTEDGAIHPENAKLIWPFVCR
ncbi:MAG: M23 family metallopeptidase [Pseudomonadota bacterium]